MDSTQDTQSFRKPERWNSVPVPERVAQRAITNIDKRSDGCWISRYSVMSTGYAQIGWYVPHSQRRPDRNGQNETVLVHRAAWVAVNGQVPLGMTIDHLCKERRCVNPEHLRLLPNFENARRIDGMDWPMGFCANGHSADRLRSVLGKRNKAGNPREGIGCTECYRLYGARCNWRTRHPHEPMPARLLLASEKRKAA